MATGHYARTSQEDEEVFQQSHIVRPSIRFRDRFEKRNCTYDPSSSLSNLSSESVVTVASSCVCVFFMLSGEVAQSCRPPQRPNLLPQSDLSGRFAANHVPTGRTYQRLCEENCSRSWVPSCAEEERGSPAQTYHSVWLHHILKSMRIIVFPYTFFWILSFFQSMGICFIGQRNFENFILEVLRNILFLINSFNVSCFLEWGISANVQFSCICFQYLEPKPGNFVCIEDGTVVGTHKGAYGVWSL